MIFDMNRVRAWLLAIVAGVAVGGGALVYLVNNLTLAITLAFVYTVGMRLLVEYGFTLPGTIYGDDWQTVRWNGAVVAFVMLAAFIGVSTTLPIPDGLRFALQWLVFGVGWMGLFFGVAMAREQAAANEPAGEAETANETESDPA
jgi:uncharacterized protein (DUF2062 family)